jgi:4-hydroxy-3-methylbut-2-en-1-yl diphosphate synthase IspG/GcpE
MAGSVWDTLNCSLTGETYSAVRVGCDILKIW